MNTLFYITNQTIERSTRVIEPVNGNLSPAKKETLYFGLEKHITNTCIGVNIIGPMLFMYRH